MTGEKSPLQCAGLNRCQRLFSTTETFASFRGFPRGVLVSMRFFRRGTACIYRNGPPQSFWGLFGWFSAGVEVQYSLQLSPTGYRFLWRGPCLWLNGADDGLRYRAHFGLPFESSCVLRSGCRQAFSGFGIVALYHRSGGRWDCSSRGTVRRRERKGRLRLEQRVRVERLRRTFAWWVFLDCMLRCRGGADILFFDDHHGSDGQTCTSRVCAYCDRAGINLDSSHWNPGYESLGKPRSEHRPGDLCRRLGNGTTLAVLGCSDYRRHRGRSVVRSDVRASCHSGRGSGG